MSKQQAKEQLSFKQRLKQWARALKADIIALYFALKHPRTPLYVKLYLAVVVGYALSPIDLIPDFVPLLGYLDEVILLPLCIALAVKIVPTDVMRACREQAKNNPPAIRPKAWIAAYVIVLVWAYLLYQLYRWLK